MNPATKSLLSQSFPTSGTDRKSVSAMVLQGLAFPGSRQRELPHSPHHDTQPLVPEAFEDQEGCPWWSCFLCPKAPAVHDLRG